MGDPVEPVPGAPVVIRVSGVRSPMFAIAVSDKDRFIAVAQHNGVVGLWQPLMAAKLGIAAPMLMCVAHDEAHAVAFEPSEPPAPKAEYTVFVTGGCDGLVRRWQLGDQLQSGTTILQHDSTVMTLAFDRRAEWLVSGSEDHTIAITRWPERRVAKKLEAHEGTVLSVAVSPDGKRIASGGYDDRAYLWSLDGKRLARLDPEDESGPVWAVKFLADDRILFTKGADIWVWTKQTGPTRLFENDEPMPYVQCLAVHPDGSEVTFGQGNGHTSMGIDGTGFRSGGGHEGDLTGIVYLADGRLATVAKDGLVLVYDDGPDIALRLESAQRP